MTAIDHLPALLNAFVCDLLSLIQVPGAGLAGYASQASLERVMKDREQRARDTLQDELRRGRKTEHNVASEDEAAAILFRYVRAAQEGAARRNLRLMAQVIRGQLEGGNLVADRFLHLSDILASLTREEIAVAGSYVKHERVANRRIDLPTTVSPINAAWRAVEEELIPSILSNKHSVKATAWGLGRHGLMWIDSEDMFGSLRSSSLLIEIADMCDLEAAGKED